MDELAIGEMARLGIRYVADEGGAWPSLLGRSL